MQENKRGNWKSWYEFLFSTIGCMVGLGNIWRFPYICFKNGGGAFLVPYFMFLIILGFPVMFAELSYSQWSNLGPGRVWICCPLFRGIGYGMICLTALVSIYYNVILAWTLYYLFYSFFPTIPWSTCDNDYNTIACYLRGQFTNITMDNSTDLTTSNTTFYRKTTTEEFWERKVLGITDGINNQGELRWQLIICLFLAWGVAFLCLLKGIKTSGKVVYVAATIPYFFLLALLVRTLFFDGAFEGLRYFVSPRWENLGKFSVWGDAAVQIFYSAGLGWGGVATLASYNNFRNDFRRDAILLLVIDGLTSWFAGCVIFTTLGYMAHQSNVPIDHVVKQGPGIAFMVYPEAIATLPLPQLWSVFFFLMLFTVGIDSQMVHIQTLTGAIFDNFPFMNKKKTIVTLCICILGFLFGLMCVTQGGIFVLQLIDWYVASVSLMIIALLECFVLAWIYGTERLNKDIEMMIGGRQSKIWTIGMKVALGFTTPCLILFVLVFSMVTHTPVSYGEYVYPEWAIGIGWIIALIFLLPIPIAMIYTVLGAKGNIKKRLLNSIKPLPTWKPAIQDDYEFDAEMEKLNHAL